MNLVMQEREGDSICPYCHLNSKLSIVNCQLSTQRSAHFDNFINFKKK